ncbi:MAG: Calx-beta domain-containing protein [Chloroflexota bacterium]
MRSRSTFCTFMVVLLLTMLVIIPVHAATLKLSAPNPNGDGVNYFEVSPDSQFVVYITDHDTPNMYELYSVPISGGAPVKLNIPLNASADIDGFRISPDSQWVIYFADAETDNVFELYSVPIDGSSTSVKLNTSFPVGSSGVSEVTYISPDSKQVVYIADQDTLDVRELYRVPINGGTPTKLNGPLVADGDVFSFVITPDGSNVIYRADQETNDTYELYRVPLTGGNAVKLASVLDNDGDISNYYLISPDSTYVVYAADREIDDEIELFSVPVAGGTSEQLNDPLPINGDVALDFAISPDSSRVVYIAEQEVDEREEMYSVPITGGTPVKLNKNLLANRDVSEDFVISPDSSRVVYFADQDTDEVKELYSVPLAGPAAEGVKLNGPLVAGGEVDRFAELQISADSRRVIYRADQDTDNMFELYSVPLAGPAAEGVKLNGPLVAGGEVDLYNYQISGDSSYVMYLADQEVDNRDELYRVPLAGGAVTKLNGPLVAGGRVRGAILSPDDTWVVYNAFQDDITKAELYVADDDAATVGFANTSATIAEDAGPAAIAIVLDAPALTPVTVDYAITGGTATNGTDFTLTDGQLTIPPGQDGGEIIVSILEDNLLEGDETVEITLSNPTNATLFTDTFTLTIEDTSGNAIYLPLVVQ